MSLEFKSILWVNVCLHSALLWEIDTISRNALKNEFMKDILVCFSTFVKIWKFYGKAEEILYLDVKMGNEIKKMAGSHGN